MTDMDIENLTDKQEHTALRIRVDFYSPFKVAPSTLQLTRLISLIISTILFLHRVFFSPAEHVPDYTFLTIWANTANMIYFWVVNIVVQVVSKPDAYIQRTLPLFRCLQVFFELLAALMFVVCLMYWGFLVPELKNLLHKNPDHYWDIIIDAYGFHLVAPILVWIEVYLNQVSFLTKDGLIFVPGLILVYSSLNFYWTKNSTLQFMNH